MGDAYLLGVDCGLTLVKAAAFAPDGRKACEACRPMPRAGDEIDGERLWEAVCACMREAAAGRRIAACGLSGHGNGLYALDGAGQLIAARPSMCDGFEPRVADAARYYELARQSVWCGQTMQLLRRLREQAPERYARVRTALLCKDYVRFRLTGEVVSEYSDASGAALLDAQTGEYSRELCALCGIEDKANAFAPLIGSMEVSGRVTAEAAARCGVEAGTKVAGGCFDVVACMLGAGVLSPGECSITAGTWGVTMAPVPGPLDSPLLTQNCLGFERARWTAIVSAPTSCVNLDWFLRGMRPDLTHAQADRVAASFGPADCRAIYLPYLHADMARPRRRAGFSDLTPASGWRELLRAVYEGVAFAHREQAERLRGAGCAVKGARLSGGATRGSVWGQLLADALGIELEATREQQVGALGAAICAAVAAGIYPTPEAAVAAMVHPGARWAPAGLGLYDEKYARFKELAGEFDGLGS